MNRRELLLAMLAAGAGLPALPAVADAGYQTLFYKSGKLNIEAYLYKPDGDGPFPFVIYNHGSRAGQEKQEVPFRYVGALLRQAGYVVLVPERRGYGRSDGTAAGGHDPVAGLEGESDDVLAGLAYARTLPFIDQKRMAIMGWSFGGIVTMFALSKSDAFKCAIDQAGGALSWKGSATVRQALTTAAGKVKVPVYFMDSENDATTEAVTTCDAVLKKNGVPQQLTIYPAFTPSQNPDKIPPGHLIFGNEGVNIWSADALGFLTAHLTNA